MAHRSEWHPEPELIETRDPERSRAALERLGERTWAEALDWLYGTAADRATAPDLYPDLRRAYFGESGAPGPAPENGRSSDEVLAEFRERFASPYVAAERGYVDEVILPRTTRAKLVQALATLDHKRDKNPPKKHGNIPL